MGRNGSSCGILQGAQREITQSPSGNRRIWVDDLKRAAPRGWDYETVEAETGAATLSAIVTERPAAALLDINLPDVSGLDLLREIKRRSPQTAVIMITAETLFENAVAALRGGADDFIGKPINLEELRFALDKALKLKRLGRELEAVNRPHILIISDSAERIPHLQAGFDSQEVEIASAVFPEEWEYVSGDKHDLAVVDVSPALLGPLLGNLRASKEHAEIPVLVEQSRIAAASLAGEFEKVGGIKTLRPPEPSPWPALSR